MNIGAAGFETGGEDVFARIAQAIESRGYAIFDGVVSMDIVDALFVQLASYSSDDALNRAAIGRNVDRQINRFVRTDDTRWLDPNEAPSCAYLDWMEQLRLGINRHLFLGLFDYEAHFARYLPGAYYKRHLDAFDGMERNRILSTVLYLNPSWNPADGGEMLLYEPGEAGAILEMVQPLYGRLAIFLSERFPHEVLTTRATRYSIAGWFRLNLSIRGNIDPPS